MRRTFSHTLLITCILILFACKTPYVPASVSTQNLSVSDTLIPLDSGIVRLYLPYKKLLEKDMDRVISKSEEEMVKDKPESSLTNFLADLLLDEGEKIAKEDGISVVPEISYFNYGGIRTFLPRGNITVGKIYELMPFENELVFVQLTGKQVKEFLDIIAGKGGDSLGGVRFLISNRHAKDISVSAKPLHEDALYWLVTNDYVAGGGDGLTVFAENLKLMNSGRKIRDVIIRHLEEKQRTGETVSGKTDGRIVYE